MINFKIGDRVRARQKVGNTTENTIGYEGTVLAKAGHQGGNILIEFDKDIKGHSGDWYVNGECFRGKYGHCWWVESFMIEKLEKEKNKVEFEEFEEDKEYKCEDCGEEITKDNGKIFYYKGLKYEMCEDCFDEKFTTCKICGELIDIDDAEYSDDKGNVYCCDECVEQDYYTCFDCGRKIDRDNGDYYYISGCYGNGDEVVCEDCRNDGWTRCCDCDELYRDDDCYYHEGDDCYYCNSCWDNHPEHEDYEGINDYHCGPSLEYYDEKGYNGALNSNNFKGYGFELEVDCGGHDHDSAREVCKLLNNEAYCCSDGSLDNGFEIISHPHTRQAMEEMPMDNVLRWLITHGYKSHDAGTCGLHLHASKLLFGDDEKERIKNIAKIVMFYEIFWDDVLKVSRRKPNQVDSWARRYGKSKADTYGMVDRVVKGEWASEGRYFAVNLSNRHTVEFRLMRGTLKKETFWATLDFLMTTVENASKIPFAKINKPELWLKGMKPGTLDYIRSRGAFASVVGENNTIQENEENEEE